VLLRIVIFHLLLFLTSRFCLASDFDKDRFRSEASRLLRLSASEEAMARGIRIINLHDAKTAGPTLHIILSENDRVVKIPSIQTTPTLRGPVLPHLHDHDLAEIQRAQMLRLAAQLSFEMAKETLEKDIKKLNPSGEPEFQPDSQQSFYDHKAFENISSNIEFNVSEANRILRKVTTVPLNEKSLCDALLTIRGEDTRVAQAITYPFMMMWNLKGIDALTGQVYEGKVFVELEWKHGNRTPIALRAESSFD
jgi:hypothetical protein